MLHGFTITTFAPGLQGPRKDMKFDKNTVAGLVAMILLVLGYSWYQANQAEEMAAIEAAHPTTQAPASGTPAPAAPNKTAPQVAAPQSPDSHALVQQYGAFGAQRVGKAGVSVLENDHVKVEINHQGASLRTVHLKSEHYKTYWGKKDIEFWDPAAQKMNWVWNDAQKGRQESWNYYFTPGVVENNNGNQKIDLTLSNEQGQSFVVTYRLAPDAHTVECQVKANNLGQTWNTGSGQFLLNWQTTGWHNEKGLSSERSRSSVYFQEQERDRDYLKENGGDEKTLEKPLNWMAFKQNYFTAAVIASQPMQSGAHLAVIQPEEDTLHTKVFLAEMPLDMSQGKVDLKFFFGPNEYPLLVDTQAEQFDKIIDYGWGIIGWVNKYAVRPLFWLLADWFGSFGLIILILTLVIKMVLFPITWKNLLNGAKMRAIKPELDELNKKYEGKDPMEKQSAMMALYRQLGVNPFAGCIPVLIQMPVLYAMFRFFPAEIVLRGKSFLWAEDLAAYDSILNFGFDIPFYGNHMSLFTLLMAASTFLYTKMSMSSQPTVQQPGMPDMNIMMNLFTFMMIFFFNSMPSGLTMYYFVANMTSIGQMWAIRKYFINEDDIRSKIETNKTKPTKKSSFQQRLEDMQNEQKRKLEAQKKKLK